MPAEHAKIFKLLRTAFAALCLSIAGIFAVNFFIQFTSKLQYSHGLNHETALYAKSQVDFISSLEYQPHLTQSVDKAQQLHPSWSYVNRAQALRSSIDLQGWSISPRIAPAKLSAESKDSSKNQDQADWHWRFESFELADQHGFKPLYNDQSQLEKEDNLVRVVHSSEVSEWYINSQKGIEQGFSINTDPDSSSEQLAIRGRLITDLNISLSAKDKLIFSDESGDKLQLAGLHAFDAKARKLPAEFQINQESEGIFSLLIKVDDRDALYPIIVDPLASTPVSFESNQAQAALGAAVFSAGDVNADGFSDLLVGAPDFDAGLAAQGRAYLFLGSSSGLLTAPAWSIDGNQAGARLGAVLATAGDINADGYSDVIVGLPGFDSDLNDVGQVRLYLGSAAGLSSEAALSITGEQLGAQFGSSLSTAGDINADGFSDIIVGSPFFDQSGPDRGRVDLYLGSSTGLSALSNWSTFGNQDNEQLGYAISFASDVNADGYADILIGAHHASGQLDNQGKALLFLGSSSGLSSSAAWSVFGEQSQASFAKALSSAGDVNGDGFADVLVASPDFDAAHVKAGKVYLFLGSASGLSTTAAWTKSGDQNDQALGTALAFAGDINADGYADIAVAASLYDHENSNEGAVFMYQGSASGLSSSPSWSAEGDQTDAFDGASIATVGDINADGFSDLVVGAPGFENGSIDEGKVYLYLGAAGMPSQTVKWSFEPDQNTANLASSVSSAGDVNGDGFADVLVGAPSFDNGLLDAGRAYLFLGSENGVAAAPSWIADGDQTQASFAYSLANAGDVNGDGYSDVIVGARFYDNGEINEGRAYLYLGSADGLSGQPAWFAEPNQEYAFFGYAVSGAGDINADGYADVAVGAYRYDKTKTDEGAVFIYMGSAQGLAVEPSLILAPARDFADFGISLASAGDVNRDGYSDLIVGARYYTNGQTNEGGAFLYLGSASGLSSTAAWIGESNQSAAGYGSAVTGVGDVNADGFSDVAVGSRFYDNGQSNEGRVYLYLGTSSGLSQSANWSAESNQANADFGSALSAAGDMNADGFSDLLIGAYRADGGFTDEGRAYLYLGSASGLGPTAAWSKEGNQASASFAFALAGAGDVNADGFSDILIGAPDFDAEQAEEGRASLFLGNEQAGLSMLPQQFDFSAALMQPLGMTRDASFSISLRATNAMGRTRARLVWQNAPLGVPVAEPGTHFASLWSDSFPPQTKLSQSVQALAHKTNYHWRARLQYHPLLNFSAWYSVGNNGLNESDLRAVLPPTPTPTPTETFTATPTVTETALPDLTVTPTQQDTPIVTPTAVYTPDLSPTPASTPALPTVTSTPTRISDVIPTPGATLTPSPSDSDNDGIPDYIEGDDDQDGDGIPNRSDLDSDADGISDTLEGFWDLDRDGLANFLDFDSDADGINDRIEAQNSQNFRLPSGKDSNRNGLDDIYEGDLSIIPIDTEADFVPDYLDQDSDDDGVTDYFEAFDLKRKGRPSVVPFFLDRNLDGWDDAFARFQIPALLSPLWRLYSGAPGCKKRIMQKSQIRVAQLLNKLKIRYETQLSKASICSKKVVSNESTLKQVGLQYKFDLIVTTHFSPVILKCPARLCQAAKYDSSLKKLKRLALNMLQIARKIEKLSAKNCKRKVQMHVLDALNSRLLTSISALAKNRVRCALKIK